MQPGSPLRLARVWADYLEGVVFLSTAHSFVSVASVMGIFLIFCR